MPICTSCHNNHNAHQSLPVHKIGTNYLTTPFALNVFVFKSTDDNDDGLITAPDIENVVLQLCGTNTFSAEDLEQLVQHVLNEAEGRESDAIGPQEFRNIISRAPDFALNFTIRF